MAGTCLTAIVASDPFRSVIFFNNGRSGPLGHASQVVWLACPRSPLVSYAPTNY
jgi:hypothetical protein